MISPSNMRLKLVERLDKCRTGVLRRREFMAALLSGVVSMLVVGKSRAYHKPHELKPAMFVRRETGAGS